MAQREYSERQLKVAENLKKNYSLQYKYRKIIAYNNW